MAGYQRQQFLFLFPLLLSISYIIYVSRNSIYQSMSPARKQKAEIEEDGRQIGMPSAREQILVQESYLKKTTEEEESSDEQRNDSYQSSSARANKSFIKHTAFNEILQQTVKFPQTLPPSKQGTGNQSSSKDTAIYTKIPPTVSSSLPTSSEQISNQDTAPNTKIPQTVSSSVPSTSEQISNKDDALNIKIPQTVFSPVQTDVKHIIANTEFPQTVSPGSQGHDTQSSRDTALNTKLPQTVFSAGRGPDTQSSRDTALKPKIPHTAFTTGKTVDYRGSILNTKMLHKVSNTNQVPDRNPDEDTVSNKTLLRVVSTERHTIGDQREQPVKNRSFYRIVTTADGMRPPAKHFTREQNQEYLARRILAPRKKNNCLPSIFNEGSPFNTSQGCTPFYNLIDICNTSAKYYNKRTLRKQRGCPVKPSERICKLRLDHGSPRIKVSCNMNACSNSHVSVKTIDSNYGIVRETRVYKSTKDLQKGVMKAVSYCLQYGFDFIILSCKDKVAGHGHQLLFLPPRIEKESLDSKHRVQSQGKQGGREKRTSDILKHRKFEAVSKQKPNINILVLDSLSRSHFLRMLPKTVAQMQLVNTAANKGMKILDFEFFQSLASFTFPNIKSFMAGQQDYVDIKTRKIDFSVLLKRFKDEGYQTMMQEDACWYDKWGTLMTSNRKREQNIKHSHDLKHEWKLLRKENKEQFVDNYGLSHFSCYGLDQYGKSNLFNSGDFCFDGKPLSAHYLEYASAIIKRQEATRGAKKQFTYTHLNTAHEATGKRVKSLDKYLAEFVRQIAILNNTLTVIWSDHGAKTTKYAVRTLAGKFEIYDALLFIAVPENLLARLGDSARTNLLRNQRAILSAQDLHNSMLYLSNWNMAENMSRNTDHGIFADKTSRTGCEDLPLRGIALCKCTANYEKLNLRDRNHNFDVLWMSEFALGTLNNQLNKEIIKQGSNYQRPRSCKWLQGISYRDALRERRKASSRFLFDVLVNHTKIQVFNIQIVQNRSKHLTMLDWQRMSLYQPFDSCKDHGASVQLCICATKGDQRKSGFEPALDSGMFGGINTLRKAAGCLVLVERKHEDEVKTYLITNICKKKITIDAFEKASEGWQSANVLPFRITVFGLTMTFLTTARKQRKNASEYVIGINKA